MWRPQPKQAVALTRPEFEILYGGARGGGKTDAGIVWMVRPEYQGRALYRGLVVRKTADDLKDWTDRAQYRYRRIGWKRSGSPPEFTHKSGAKIRTGHLRDEDAYEKYQGHEYQRMMIEELTQIPTESAYLKLISSCRSTIGLTPQVFATTNPGGVGHQWVKERFVSPAPAGGVPIIDPVSGRSRIFIPATVEDNPILMTADPDYVRFLDSLPPGLREAWREGNWDFVVGAAFQELSQRHLYAIDPTNPPDRLHHVFDFELMTPKPGIKVYRSMDWGYSKPFSIGWYFTDYDGRLYRYREMYGCKAANEGVQMPARDVALKIKEIEEAHKENPVLCVADASIWDKPSNQNIKAEKLPSIAETMQQEGVWWHRDISIEAKKSRIQGKHQCHERFRLDADNLPGVFVFNSCVHWWRTVPVLPLDSLNPEDVDTEDEDHAYDEFRYMLSARPYKSSVASKPAPVLSHQWMIEQGYHKPLDRFD